MQDIITNILENKTARSDQAVAEQFQDYAFASPWVTDQV
jgi:hypothetical protein